MKRRFNTASQITIKNDGDKDFILPKYRNRSQTSQVVKPEQELPFEISEFGSSVYYYVNTRDYEVETSNLYTEGDEPFPPVEENYIYAKGSDSDVGFDLYLRVDHEYEKVSVGTNLTVGNKYKIIPEDGSGSCNFYINGSLVYGEEESYSFTLTSDMSVNNKVTISVKGASIQQATLTYSMGNYATGGSVPSPVSVNVGSSVLVVGEPHPERDGYTFIGWAVTDGAVSAEYTAGASIQLFNNITLYPVFASSSQYRILRIDRGQCDGAPQGTTLTVNAYNEEDELKYTKIVNLNSTEDAYVKVPADLSYIKISFNSADFRFTFSGQYDSIAYSNTRLYLDPLGGVYCILIPSEYGKISKDKWDMSKMSDSIIYVKYYPYSVEFDTTLYPNFSDRFLILVLASDPIEITQVAGNKFRFPYEPTVSYTVRLGAKSGSTYYSDVIEFSGKYGGNEMTDVDLNTVYSEEGRTDVKSPTNGSLWSFNAYDYGSIKFTLKDKVALIYSMGEYATGGDVPDPVKANIDEDVTVSFNPHPTKTDYNFVGWSTTDGASTADYTADGTNTITLYSNVILYPVFEAAQPIGNTISIINNSYSGIEIYKNERYQSTISINSSYDLEYETQEGYTFVGSEKKFVADATFTGTYQGNTYTNEPMTVLFKVIKSPLGGDSWSFNSGDSGTLTISENQGS